MNSDIRLSIGWNRHPKIIKLKRKLGADGVLALINLWTFAGEHRPSGVFTCMDEDDIAIAAEYPGDSVTLVDTLSAIRLIERQGNDWAIHDWEENNPWASGAEMRSEKAKKAASARWNRENLGGKWPENSGKNAPSIKSNAPSIEKYAQGNAPSPSPSPSPFPSPFPNPSPREREREGAPAACVISPALAPAPARPESEFTMLLPAGLTQETWNRYCVYRKSIDKAMNSHSERAELSKLSKMRSEGHDPTRVVELAISNGWKGLYAKEETRLNQTDTVKDFPLAGRPHL